MPSSRCLFALLLIMSVLISGCNSLVGRTGGKGLLIVVQPDPTAKVYWSTTKNGRAKILEETRDLLERRLAGVDGVIDPSVELRGDALEFVIPDSINSKTVLSQLIASGKLEFYFLKDIQGQKNPIGKWRMEAPTMPNAGYIFTDSKRNAINSINNPNDVLVKVVDVSNNKPILTGRDVLPNAKANINRVNQIVVCIEFNADGARKFSNFTREHVDDYLAVFFNDRLITSPKINEPILGSEAEIAGFVNLRQAKQAADQLNSGQMPVMLRVVSKKHVKM
ncbi:MAG: hypothetical protein ABFD83_08995 [Armatimonadota bacterium]